MSVKLRGHPVQLKPYVGVWITGPVQNILKTAQRALDIKFEFLCCNITHRQGASPEFLESPNVPLTEIFCWSSRDLSAADWNSLIVGCLKNPEIELSDELNDKLRRNANYFLGQQLDYCTHLNLVTCMIGFKTYVNAVNSISTIYSKLLSGVNYRIWINLPMFGPFVQEDDSRDESWERSLNHIETEAQNPWIFWNKTLALTNHQKDLFLALRLPNYGVYNPMHVKRWLTEPVKCLIINLGQFRVDLSKPLGLRVVQKEVVKRFLEMGTPVMLETDSIDVCYKKYYDVIESIKKEIVKERKRKTVSVRSKWGAGFENKLMDPMQPLVFDLSTSMYESFEQDHVKYALYEDAIHLAMLDMKARRSDDSKSEKIVVLIAGAGRGPIVESALKAAIKANLLDSIDLYALDKNEMTVNTLLHSKRTTWKDKVKVVCADMRTWMPPTGKVDIIVSELLGSFGDNELSPECLDGAQRYLKADGIIIPQSYSSFVQPIMSAEVYRAVRNLKSERDSSLFERTYVVNFRNHINIAEPKRLFTFDHPADINDQHHTNSRHSCLDFSVTEPCVLHGFAGYFESTLYKDVVMSIKPRNHTDKMISWWPFFIPIRNHISLNEGDRLTAHFYRKVETSRVWYEWGLTSPTILSFHNVNGRHHCMAC